MSGLAFHSPGVLFALAVPVLVLLFAKLFARPERHATGSLVLWKRLAARAGEAASSKRPGVPLPLWLLSGALAAAILALAGPRIDREVPGRLWRVIVDRTPSMYLACLPERGSEELKTLSPSELVDRTLLGASESNALLRIEVALDAALTKLAENWKPGDRVRFSSPGRNPLQLDEPVSPPADWLAPERAEAAELDLVANDTRGTLFVTDRAVRVESASLFASGGEAVPGLVGRRGGDRLEWRGGKELVELDGEPRTVLYQGMPDGAVDSLFEHWASDRGFLVTNDWSERSTPALSVWGAWELLPERSVVGRDGWSLDVRRVEGAMGPELDFHPREVWLEHEGEELVYWKPGQIVVRWGEDFGPPGGDPAAFAVSWAKLFDRAVLPEVGAVSLAERQSAGAPKWILGEPPVEPALANPPTRLDSVLAWVAAVLAAAGAWSLLGRASKVAVRDA